MIAHRMPAKRIRYLAAAVAMVAVWFAGPRVVEKFRPEWRIAAQLTFARLAEAMGHDVVLLLGDSRMAALGRRTLTKPGTRAINLGLSGMRAHELRALIARETLPRRAVSVIWIGVNDIWFEDAKSTAVAGDLRQIVATLAAHGHRVVLLEQIPAGAEIGSVQRRITRESRAINALFDETPPQGQILRIADLFEIAVETGSTPKLHDGIHLTANANEQVWQRIAGTIETRTTDRKP